uniref:Uncharacterized protein n=1 Tax=Oncorhynchus tshawytscha TaxID=74940 RepID=A0AAZ3SB71_ONCTS
MPILNHTLNIATGRQMINRLLLPVKINKLHVAHIAYFPFPFCILVIMKQPPAVTDFGTALHITTSNLYSCAINCMLDLGANPTFRCCVPTSQLPADRPVPLDMPLEMADTTTLAKELCSLLWEAPAWPCTPLPLPLTLPALAPPGLSDKAQAQITTMNIQLGDRMVIAGQKVGYQFQSLN